MLALKATLIILILPTIFAMPNLLSAPADVQEQLDEIPEWEYDRLIVDKLLDIMKLMEEKWEFKLTFKTTKTPLHVSSSKESVDKKAALASKESTTSAIESTESTKLVDYTTELIEPIEQERHHTEPIDLNEPTEYTTNSIDPTDHSVEPEEPELYTMEPIEPEVYTTEPIEPEESTVYTTEVIEPTDVTLTSTDITFTTEIITESPDYLSCPESWPFHDAWEINAQTCELDSECSEGQLCCQMFESFYCVQAVDNTPKEGECPYVRNNEQDMTTPQCLEDYPGCKFDLECPESHKCCPGPCRYRSCVAPIPLEAETAFTTTEQPEAEHRLENEEELPMLDESLAEMLQNPLSQYEKISAEVDPSQPGQPTVVPVIAELTSTSSDESTTVIISQLMENNNESDSEAPLEETLQDGNTSYEVTTLYLEDTTTDLPPDSPMNITSTETPAPTEQATPGTELSTTSKDQNIALTNNDDTTAGGLTRVMDRQDEPVIAPLSL